MSANPEPAVVIVGNNPTPIWGMSNEERVRRIARAQNRQAGTEIGAGPQLLVNLAYCFDPPLLRYLATQPRTVLLRDGVPVVAHVDDADVAAQVAQAMTQGSRLAPQLPLARIDHGPDFSVYNAQLRKREQPFVLPLTPSGVPAIERASYYAAYKGVTDVLTKYLWPEWALVLTRYAARAGISPNGVTAVGFVFCVLATLLFWHGWYWSGLAAGLGFMVLDTVDGKLARCTITSSWWGNVFDHGIDLVHPPFWYLAWGIGLSSWERTLPPGQEGAVAELASDPHGFWLLQGALLAGYVLQRLIEGAFLTVHRLDVHVWRRFDSRFRLITARRNPNMVILLASLIAGRPDLGLVGVAAWTIVSLLVHIVQLVQASWLHARGVPITSWLAEAPQ